jgi:prepilin signal peptidase PulO-like enzyme (type II secretory pathway)
MTADPGLEHYMAADTEEAHLAALVVVLAASRVAGRIGMGEAVEVAVAYTLELAAVVACSLEEEGLGIADIVDIVAVAGNLAAAAELEAIVLANVSEAVAEEPDIQREEVA